MIMIPHEIPASLGRKASVCTEGILRRNGKIALLCWLPNPKGKGGYLENIEAYQKIPIETLTEEERQYLADTIDFMELCGIITA